MWGHGEVPRHERIDVAAAGATAVCLAVSDDALPSVVSRLAEAPWPAEPPLVFHLAGSVPLEVLRPAAQRGAVVGSLHPMRAFPRVIGEGAVLEGHLCAVTCVSPSGRGRLDRLARDAGGHPVDLKDEDRTAWHLAGVAGSNFLVALMDMAEGLMAQAGVEEETARSGLALLAEGALRAVKEVGPRRALTGPVARGDRRTLERHRRYLEDYPGFSRVYDALVASMKARIGETSDG